MRKKLIWMTAILLALLAFWFYEPLQGRDEGGSADARDGSVRSLLAPVKVIRGSSPVDRLGATIVGRVTVESGSLPPAQVCASSARLAQLSWGFAWTPLQASLGSCAAPAKDGAYRIDGLLPGQYIVSAEAEGYLVLRHVESDTQPWITLASGQLREGLDFMLRSRGVPVRGVVHDVAGGTIAGALVIDDLGGHAWTDEGGNFTLWAMSGALLPISATANGYTRDAKMAKPPQTAMNFWLTPESVLRGRVVRGDPEEPLAGLAVHLRYPEIVDGETNSDGSFEIRGLEPGNYQPFVRGEGFCGVAEPPVALGLGETSEPVLVRAVRCRNVKVSVVVRPSGAPCGSAQLNVLDTAGDTIYSAVADPSGRAELSGLEPGVYQVRIVCAGHIQRSLEPWVLGEAMTSEVVWEVEVGRTVRGVVVDPHGERVPRANVSIEGTWGFLSVVCNDRGEFTAAVQPGTAKLTPYHPRMSSEAGLEVEVAESGELPPVTLKFPSSYAGEIHGRVRTRDGAAPGRLFVTARAIGALSARSAGIDDEGRYTIGGLARLAHEVVVQRAFGLGERSEAGELATIVAPLDERESVEIDFVVTLPPRVKLSGRVEGAEGEGESEALVTVTSRFSSRLRTLTDERGHFEVEVTDATPYTIEVTTRGGASAEKSGVRPGEPVVLRMDATREVCGVIEGEFSSAESLSISVDAGESQSFQAGTRRWCLSHVRVGERTLTSRSVRFGSAIARVSVPLIGVIPEVTLEFSGRSTLRGRVLDGEGRPRANYKVWVLEPTGRLVGGNIYTDDTGTFAVDGVPAGELSVIPIPPGPLRTRQQLLAESTKVTVQEGRPTEVLLSVP